MKFFKANSYDIVKLYINQIGISIFSLFLSFAVRAVDVEDSKRMLLSVLLSALSLLFYSFLLYTAAWDMGAKDKIRIDGGRLTYDRSKGAKLSLFANVPNFVLAGLCILLISVDMLLPWTGWRTVYSIFIFPLIFTTVMYNGILQGILSGLRDTSAVYLLCQSVGFFLAPLFAVLVTQLGYYMGVKDRRIMQAFKPRPKE